MLRETAAVVAFGDSISDDLCRALQLPGKRLRRKIYQGCPPTR
jgi:hypothetical protein